MNALCYKIVFSKRLGTLVAVGEHTAGQGKAAGTGVRTVVFPSSSAASAASADNFVGLLKSVFASVALSFVTVGYATAAGPAVNTLPTGYSVNSGNVAISSTSSATNAAMTIQQTSDKASVNWNSFSIGSGAAVNVQQNNANSVLLNRVVGNEPSQILGKLTANGQVILINPNGVVFGKGGSVTASAFTASTFGMTDADFLAGKHKFSRDGSTAGVTVEEGASIDTTGYVALIGASVDNQGKISTKGGSVVLASGETVPLPKELTDNISVPLSKKVSLELAPSTINASIENSGTITTHGGHVLMQAAAISNAVASITHTGTIDTTDVQGGKVDILADHGQIRVSGSITANSTKGTAGGSIIIGREDKTDAVTGKVTTVLAAATDVSGAKLESQGGFVETSGHDLVFANTVVKAKDWLLDPTNLTVNASNVSSVVNSLDTNTSVTLTTGVSGQPGDTGSDVGNITIDADITKTSAAESTLNLIANNSIVLNKNISSTTGKLNINLTAKEVTKNNDFDFIQTGKLTTTTLNVNGAGTWQIGDGVTNGAVALANNTPVSFNISKDATLSYNVVGNTIFDSVSSIYKGVGTLQKIGTGTLRWGSNGNATFAMDSGSLIKVQQGTFVGANSYGEVWTDNKSNLYVDASAAFQGAEGNIRVNALTGGGSVSTGWSNQGSFTMGVDNTATGTGSATFSGTLTATGSSGLIKTGSYTQILTGNSDFTGTTTVNGGTLQIGEGESTGTLGKGNVSLANSSNLIYKRNVNTEITNAISGTGNVTADITGGGNLKVSKAINLSGGGNIYLQSTAGAIETAAAMTGTNISLDNTGYGINITSGAINTTGNSSTGTAATGIVVNAAVTANGGNIVIGAISTTGYGLSAAGGLKANKVSGAGGNITLTGASTSRVGFVNTGSIWADGALYIKGTQNTTTTGSGWQGANISANLTGASVYVFGSSVGHHGVDVASSALIKSTSGDVYLEGKASNTATNLGVNGSSGAQILGRVEAAKKLTIIGTTSDAGLYQGLVISNAVKGESVLIQGTSVKNLGVALDSGSAISATGGDVNILGESGDAVQRQSGLTGVRIYNASTISAKKQVEGTGNINITGKVDTQSGQSGTGVAFERFPNAARFTADADISITGTVTGNGGGSGIRTGESSQTGAAPMMIAGGKFTLQGNNRAASGTGNESAAIYGRSGLQVQANGDIVIQAETRNDAVEAIAFTSDNLQISGNASFISTGGNVLIQANKGRINFANAMSTSVQPGPTYTSLTDIKGKNITIDNTGGDFDGTGVFVAGQGYAANYYKMINGVNTLITPTGVNLADGRILTASGKVNIFGASATVGNGVYLKAIINNNPTTGGVTNIQANKGNIQLASTAAITNDTNAGAINIVAGDGTKLSTSAIISETGATITQKSAGGVTMSTDGKGNLTVANIVNSGSGNVILAAGKQLDAGNGGDGQVKTVSGNTVTNDTSQTHIYSGSAAGTDLANLMAGNNVGKLATLYLTNVGATAQNAEVNRAFGAAASDKAPAQVMFRENIQFDAKLNPTSFTKNFGETDPSTAAFRAALKTENTSIETALTTTTNTGGKQFKVGTAEFIDTLTGTLPGTPGTSRGAGTYNYSGSSSKANIAVSSVNAARSIAQLTVNQANITPVPSPVVPTNSNSRVKVPVGSTNPFALASAEDLADDTCSANSIENCYCEESAVSQGVDICYEPKAGAKGASR